MKKLNEFQLKLIYMVITLVGIISIISIVFGLWVYFIDSTQFLGAIFPAMWGGVGLYNVCKVIVLIRIQKKLITSRQIRSCFFSYSRGTLASLTYILVVISDIKNAIWMCIFTVLMFVGEIFINYLEDKNIKNNM